MLEYNLEVRVDMLFKYKIFLNILVDVSLSVLREMYKLTIKVWGMSRARYVGIGQGRAQY